MNKKVKIANIVLSLVFIVCIYFLKFYMPNRFVMVVSNTRLVEIGSFIEQHLWIYFIFNLAIGIGFDLLYFGSVLRTLHFKSILYIIIMCYNIALAAIYTFAPAEFLINYADIISSVSSLYMVLLPAIFTEELIPLATTYSVNIISQRLCLSIRNIGTLMTNTTCITQLLMSLECYLWVWFCFLLFNKK